MKVKSPESLPLSRTAETSFPSVISLSTSARERPHPSAISRTGRTGIRAAKRTETSIFPKLSALPEQGPSAVQVIRSAGVEAPGVEELVVCVDAKFAV
jgi:hypothetical protein